MVEIQGTSASDVAIFKGCRESLGIAAHDAVNGSGWFSMNGCTSTCDDGRTVSTLLQGPDLVCLSAAHLSILVQIREQAIALLTDGIASAVRCLSRAMRGNQLVFRAGTSFYSCAMRGKLEIT